MHPENTNAPIIEKKSLTDGFSTQKPPKTK